MADNPKYEAYKLYRDVIFEAPGFCCILHAGELCEYFRHSDTYIFKSREGYVPFFSRSTVEKCSSFFQPVCLGNDAIRMLQEMPNASLANTGSTWTCKWWNESGQFIVQDINPEYAVKMAHDEFIRPAELVAESEE